LKIGSPEVKITVEEAQNLGAEFDVKLKRGKPNIPEQDHFR
jgi:hypothetical protein